MMAIDEAKLNEFMGNFVRDMGAVAHASTIVIGDQLGLYKALAQEPMTAAALAAKVGCDARYVLEWLSAQAASGYAQYDPATQLFSLSEEQSMALAVEGSPVFLPGAFQIAIAMFAAVPEVDRGIPQRRGHGLARTSRRPVRRHRAVLPARYAANLVSHWIPALDGVEAKLEAGASVADVGCGHGASTIIMAQAYPKSSFVGYDYHEPSIRHAREAAAKPGVADRVRFEVAKAQDFPATDSTSSRCSTACTTWATRWARAAHVRKRLKPDGTWLIVEPFANDQLEDNLNPVGRVFYSASTCICTPASRSQEVGLCLGAQAGEARLRSVVTRAASAISAAPPRRPST